jgi:hypothetical protein
MELRVVQPDLASYPKHLLRLLVHEHADLQDTLRERGGYLPRLLEAHLAWALGEDEPDGIRA